MVYSPSPFTNLSLTTSVNPSSFHYLHGHLASSSMKTPSEVSRAKKAFVDFIQHYENDQLSLQARLERDVPGEKNYHKITLIKETYEHCNN